MKTIENTITKSNEIKQTFQSSKPGVFEEYILWTACPEPERIVVGIETQKQFADHYGVRPATLTKWNSIPEFRARVRYLRDQWAFHRTGTVINGIYRSAVKGNDKSQKLWMQLFEGFTEKTESTEIKKVEVGVNDIRFLIDALPEPLKSKHYGNLRELLDDASAVRNARAIEDDRWDERPAQTISDETDNNAHDIPSKRANVVAFGYTERVCKNMERKVSENYHKSSKRWG